MMDRTDCWQRFTAAADAVAQGAGSVARAYIADVRRRCGDAVAERQERELRRFIDHLRRKK